MRQLSGMDATFLNMETRSTFGHVSSLNIFDVSGLDDDSFFEGTRRLVEDRLGLLPPFRRRLVEVPLGLDLPYWIEDPDFDLDFHVRHHAVPAPGTPAAVERCHQPHPRQAARSHPTVVGVVRHRRGRRRANGRDVHQGPPRHDRWSVGGDDARQPSRRRPRGQPDARGGSVALPTPFPATAS